MKIIRFLKYSLLFIVVLIVAAVAGSFISLFVSVKRICVEARTEYGKDCIASLCAYISTDTHSFKERNEAIWALGQIADGRALPLLTELNRTALFHEKCNGNSFLCKYEIEKAIKWCTKGNITSWMYKGRDNWK